MDLRIDPEFRDKIPPLTQAEFNQLKENILSAGEVYEPIVVCRVVKGKPVDSGNSQRARTRKDKEVLAVIIPRQGRKGKKNED